MFLLNFAKAKLISEKINRTNNCPVAYKFEKNPKCFNLSYITVHPTWSFCTSWVFWDFLNQSRHSNISLPDSPQYIIPRFIADFDGDNFVGPSDIEHAVQLLTQNELAIDEMESIWEKASHRWRAVHGFHRWPARSVLFSLLPIQACLIRKRVSHFSIAGPFWGGHRWRQETLDQRVRARYHQKPRLHFNISLQDLNWNVYFRPHPRFFRILVESDYSPRLARFFNAICQFDAHRHVKIASVTPHQRPSICWTA